MPGRSCGLMTNVLPERSAVLLARLGPRLCAFPLTGVIECLRPLPVETLPNAPQSVLGVSVIRGKPVPVVDLRPLLGAPGDTPPGRFVLLRLGERRVALTVASVLGVRQLDRDAFQDLPPLLQGAGDEVVNALGVRDEQLLFLLQPARAVPDEVWAALEQSGRQA